MDIVAPPFDMNINSLPYCRQTTHQGPSVRSQL
jgi:hypothetical protein